MHRILVIDDDPAIVLLLKRGLTYEGYAVKTANSGEEGLAAAIEFKPNLVILDLMMPGLDGLAVLADLREDGAHLPVLLLTAKDAPADQVRGLEAGADDYVVKPFTFQVLLARVHALLRRQQAEHSKVLTFADLTLDTGEQVAHRAQRTISLTSIEFKLLHEFLQHPRKVLSKQVLLDRVWGFDFGGTTNVVEVYVKQLRQKLEAAGEPRLIQTLYGAGYILRED